MANEPEGGVPQNPTPEVPPKGSGEPEVIQVPKKDFEDLKHRAEVSGQNFERLEKEREKTAELEREIAALKENPVPSNMDADRLGSLESDLREMKAKETRREVNEAFPQLKDVKEEFETYLQNPENKGMHIKTAAKAFLTEKGLLDGGAPRKGLERGTGGDHQPIPQGMSVEDAEKLRKTDYKRYRELIKKGQLKVNYNS